MAEPAVDMRYLLGLFKLADPDGLDALQRQLGRASMPLGGPLGGSDSSTENAKGLTSLEMCVAAAEALRRLRRVTEPARLKVAHRLKWASRLGLGGEVVAAVAAAGLLTALWGQPPKDAAGHATAIGLAACSLCGATLSLLARYLRRDLSGTDGTLTATHRKLADSNWEAETLGAKLELVASKGAAAASSADARLLIERAEKLATELYRTVTDLGVPIGT